MVELRRRSSKALNPTADGRTGGIGKRQGELGDGTQYRRDDSTWEGTKGRIPFEEFKDPKWERQPGERDEAYQAFLMYRGMMPLTRTQRNLVASMMHQMPERSEEGVRNQVSVYSARWYWVERCRAYDAWQDTVFLAQQEVSIRARAATWFARANDIREVEFELALALANKVRDMVKWPISRTTRKRISRDGHTTYLTIIEPARWDFKAAADILARLAYQARLSADMPTEGTRAISEPTSQATSDVDAWLNELGATGNVVQNPSIPVEE